MQSRHRIPTIFNLSMVDVLCCALGCVILLWLVNLREAKRRAKAAGETGARLVETRKELASVREALTASQRREQLVKVQLEETLSDRDRAQQLALATKQDFDRIRAAHDTALADLANLRKDLKAMRTANALLAGDLAGKSKDLAGLGQRLAAASATAGVLEKQLLQKKTQLASTGAQVDELTGRLNEALGQVTNLERKVAAVTATRAKDLDKLNKDLADANRRFQDLLKFSRDMERQALLGGQQMGEAKLSIAALQLEKRTLEERMRLARLAAENRFAGIELTGRRVVFLVDMSGSMELIDEQTIAPDKWPLLCETLAKIMKSLPDLTHYQVILFSDKVTYALGNERRWIGYDKDTSAKTVHDALVRIKPKGGTNMAAAFAEAFQLRALGMDTMYVFSDGLPNMGDGLPADGDKLSEADRTAYCSKHVRQMLKTVWNRRGPLQPGVRINAVGFFFESPDVGSFLWAMAREHEGSFVGMSRP
jgi:von Willebrand factor type A domain